MLSLLLNIVRLPCPEILFPNTRLFQILFCNEHTILLDLVHFQFFFLSFLTISNLTSDQNFMVILLVIQAIKWWRKADFINFLVGPGFFAVKVCQSTLWCLINVPPPLINFREFFSPPPDLIWTPRLLIWKSFSFSKSNGGLELWMDGCN